jgi:peroxiredoxin
MKVKALAILLAAALLLPIAVCGAPATGLAVGQQAPDFTLQLRGEGSVTLSELRGKPVVLNFFTTWCGPCQVEMPDLQAVFEEYGDRAHMLGVSVGEDPEVVDAFLGKSVCTYPMAYDPYGTVSTAYEIEFIPQTWVVDAEGVVVAYIAGRTDAQALRKALDQAL